MDIKQVIHTVRDMENEGVIGPWAVGGAVAAIFYLEPFSTLDVDVFVTLQATPGSLLLTLDPLLDHLKGRGFVMEGEYVVIGGWPVQFLPPTGPLVEEALEQAVLFDVDGVAARIFRAEHLAAIALQTGRAKDKSRLLQFVESGKLDATSFQSILERHRLGDAWQRFTRQFFDDTP
jgi:hypothetical protein